MLVIGTTLLSGTNICKVHNASNHKCIRDTSNYEVLSIKVRVDYVKKYVVMLCCINMCLCLLERCEAVVHGCGQHG